MELSDWTKYRLQVDACILETEYQDYLHRVKCKSCKPEIRDFPKCLIRARKKNFWLQEMWLETLLLSPSYQKFKSFWLKGKETMVIRLCGCGHTETYHDSDGTCLNQFCDCKCECCKQSVWTEGNIMTDLLFECTCQDCGSVFGYIFKISICDECLAKRKSVWIILLNKWRRLIWAYQCFVISVKELKDSVETHLINVLGVEI